MSFELTNLPRLEMLEACAKEYPDLDPLAICAHLALLRVSGELSAALDAHFARNGISQGRFTVLMLLWKAEGGRQSPAELADKAGVSRATMTGLLDTLEQAELTRREGNPTDRRALVVTLTDKARGFLQGMLPDHFRRTAALMGALSAKERQELIRLLGRVHSGIPAMRDP